MPLQKSSSKEAFSKNVAEMMHAGHPQDQSVAAAYSVKREAEHSHSERHEHEKKKYGK